MPAVVNKFKRRLQKLKAEEVNDRPSVLCCRLLWKHQNPSRLMIIEHFLKTVSSELTALL
jgi:hypothetical protein